MGPRDHNRAWGAQQAPGILMELGDQNESLDHKGVWVPQEGLRTTMGREIQWGPKNTREIQDQIRTLGVNMGTRDPNGSWYYNGAQGLQKGTITRGPRDHNI